MKKPEYDHSEWEQIGEITKSIEDQNEILARYRIHVNSHGEFSDAHLTEQERIDYIWELDGFAFRQLPYNSGMSRGKVSN